MRIIFFRHTITLLIALLTWPAMAGKTPVLGREKVRAPDGFRKWSVSRAGVRMAPRRTHFDKQTGSLHVVDLGIVRGKVVVKAEAVIDKHGKQTVRIHNVVNDTSDPRLGGKAVMTEAISEHWGHWRVLHHTASGAVKQVFDSAKLERKTHAKENLNRHGDLRLVAESLTVERRPNSPGRARLSVLNKTILSGGLKSGLKWGLGLPLGLGAAYATFGALVVGAPLVDIAVHLIQTIPKAAPELLLAFPAAALAGGGNRTISDAITRPAVRQIKASQAPSD